MGLVDCLEAVRKRKILIVLVTILIIALAGGLTVALPDTYEAEATLFIEESIIPAPKQASQPGPAVLQSLGSTYRRIVASKDIIKEALTELNLDEKTYDFDWEKLRERVTVETIRGSRLISVTAELPDPEMAKRLASFVAEAAVEKAASASISSETRGKKLLEERLEDARTDLKKATRELRTFLSEAELPSLEKERSTLLNRKSRRERELSQNKIEIEKKRQKLAKVKETLAGQDRTFFLVNSLLQDQAYQEVLSSLTEQESPSLLGLSMRNEMLNPIYMKLEKNRVNIETELGALQAEAEAVKQSLEETKQQLNQVHDRIVELETRKTKLRRTHELKDQIYRNVAQKLDELQLELASRTNALKLVDEPLTPTRPSGLGGKHIMAAGSVAGVLLALLLACFLEYIEIAVRTAEGGTADSDGITDES